MTFSLTFSHLRGNFTLARDESSSTPNPYIVFKAGGQKAQTKALRNVEDLAEWRESYTLHDIPEKSAGVLEVIVHNHKTILPDDTIGSGTANISSWSSKELTGQGDVIVQLIDKRGRGAGNLTFRAKHSMFSIEAARRAVGQLSAETENQMGGANQGAGKVDAVGAGTNYEKEAATKAAQERREISLEKPDGVVAAGKPVGLGAREAPTSQQISSSAVRDLQYESGIPRSPRTASTEAGKFSSLQSPRKATQLSNETGKFGGLHSPKQAALDVSKSGGSVEKPPSGVRGVDVQQGEVIDRRYYTGRENRPQEQALVEQFREHHPYTRRYETTVEHTGRERQIGSRIETLGTEVHILDSRNHVNLPPHEAIKSAIPADASEKEITGDGWTQGERGPICEAKKFEITGDHVVDKKRVTKLREHRDFEKEFEIKTTFVGEFPLPDKHYVEQLSRERVLREEREKNPCEGHKALDIQA